MSEPYDNRNPDQLQRDIDRTRADMDETLETIKQRLSPGELLDQALHYFRHSGPSQFTSNLGDTVKENPVPVSLIGVGIAWLMMGGSRGSGTSQTSTATGNVGSRMGETTGRAAGKAGQVAQGARERTGEARARMGEMAHGAQEQLGETTERLRSQTRDQAARAKTTFDYLLSEQPLILGALGLALGAALGTGLPPTRREDELLGETRDEYVHRAREAGEEQLEKAKHVAAAAGEASKEQAKREGTTSESADQRLREAGDKAERVTQAARQAAKEEANKQGLSSPSE